MEDFINRVDNSDDDHDTVTEDTYKPSSINYTPKPADPDWILYITKSGAFIPYDMLDVDHSNILEEQKAIKKLENYFTLKSIQKIGGMKSIKRCINDKKNRRIIVPRFGVFEVLNHKFLLDGVACCLKIKKGDRPNNQFTWRGRLKPNQQIIWDYMAQHIYNDERYMSGSAGCILNLEAGQGKSFLAAYAISHFRRKTAIILHSTSMIEQWENDVLKVCFPNIKIGYYYGKKKKDGDIIIMIIDSAASSEFTIGGNTMSSIEFYNQFGFIIYDECHLYANKHAGKALSVGQAPYMLGLSATPDENANKFDKMVWWSLGPVLTASKLQGYVPTDKNFKAIVHRINYHGSPLYTRLIKNASTDMTSVTETISMICEDKERIALIVKCIRECRENNLYTFVFADRRDYLEILRNALEAEDKQMCERDGVDIMTTPKDYMRIVGGAKNSDLKKAEDHAKVIFTTYQYMGTGKSIVKMNGLVLATPRKSKMKQYIGRILRLGSDQTVTRHIYDIVDSKLVLKNQWYARHKYYKERGFTVTETKVESSACGKTKSKRVQDMKKANGASLQALAIVNKIRFKN